MSENFKICLWTLSFLIGKPWSICKTEIWQHTYLETKPMLLKKDIYKRLHLALKLPLSYFRNYEIVHQLFCWYSAVSEKSSSLASSKDWDFSSLCICLWGVMPFIFLQIIFKSIICVLLRYRVMNRCDDYEIHTFWYYKHKNSFLAL